jgi:hypothetical protein
MLYPSPFDPFLDGKDSLEVRHRDHVRARDEGEEEDLKEERREGGREGKGRSGTRTAE